MLDEKIEGMSPEDVELKAWTTQFIDEYRPALEALAGLESPRDRSILKMADELLRRYRKDFENLAKR